MRSIEQIIDDALIPKPRIRSGLWNPSSFGYCYRSQYWNRQDKPKSNLADARGRRVMNVGTMFHEFVQGLIVRVEPCMIEVPVESEDVKGFCDIVRENEAIELKSQHSKSFWWMAKKDCNIRVEKYGNWLQVMYYARELGKDFGRLCFISKDDFCIKEYVEPLDDYWQGRIDGELEMLQFFWETQTLPPATPRCATTSNKKLKKISYWHCTYCGFLDTCIELEESCGRTHPSKTEWTEK